MTVLASSACVDPRLKSALALAAPVGRGKTKGARLVQELLGINGINVGIDGDYGSGTQTGLDDFCSREGIAAVTQVNQGLLDRLAQPLLRAVLPVAPAASLGDTIVAVARQHVKEHPIEVGKANSGPWVRLYMRGSDGPDFLWCAGFVSYIYAAAATAHGRASPITYTFSCDAIANEAKRKGKFVKRSSPAAAPPGSIFLVPSATHAADWIHTGIITGVQAGGTVFGTCEGNTNATGSRNGFEACARTRGAAKVDLVLL